MALAAFTLAGFAGPAGLSLPKAWAQPANPFPDRVQAPSLDGGEAWLNVGGPLSLKDLRGKFVVLDFWTYCCINCMHILPELKKLEHAFPNEVVVIGVHSAKFDNEQDTKNIQEAILRYEIEHPVINDAHHVLWDKFQVTSWPSLRIIDPEGFVVGGESGEVTFDVLEKFIKGALPYYRSRKLLDPAPLKFDIEAQKAADTPLRFPGKVLADADGDRLFISDSNHNRIVVTKLDGTLLMTIGSGAIGKADGAFEHASFDHPQGTALKGDDLYIADTENHLLRKANLTDHKVTTIAGTGKQARGAQRGLSSPQKVALSSPWALCVHGKDLFIAMAGPHQIWRMALPHGEIGPWAGNGREDIVDGPRLPGVPYEDGFASFAQPSGLTSDGKKLYIADSEGSSIRVASFDQRTVETVIGTAGQRGGRLFTFGDVDGEGSRVRLQHPLDVAWRAGHVYVADTYNNKIKDIDLSTSSCTTLAGTLKPGSSDHPARFDEPEGLSVAGDRLYVADTNNHHIRVIDLPSGAVSTLEIAGLTSPAPVKALARNAFKGAVDVKHAPVAVNGRDRQITLHVKLRMPAGFKINAEAPLRYLIESTAAAGPIDRQALGQVKSVEARESEFEIALPVIEKSGQENLRVSVGYYYCNEGAEGKCFTGSVAWTVPVEVNPQADTDTIELEHTVAHK